jgi:hypothetical protein
MLIYDPQKGLEPDVWLSLDESERIDLVRSYHKKLGVQLPNEKLHALFHVVVENQVALCDETPIKGTLVRLMNEGLSRHDAVHAIGSVLADQIYETSKSGSTVENPEHEYYSKLNYLTAASWLSNADE